MRSGGRTSTAELDGGGDHGGWAWGGIFRYPAVGLFQQGGSWDFWVLLLMYHVHWRITHRKVCHVHDSSVLNDLVVVCVQTSVTETFSCWVGQLRDPRRVV